LPETGFSHRHVTVLSAQPAEKAYADLGNLWLEVPRLNLQMPIVGVPQVDGEWDVSWLGDQAGWLQGSAFPTWSGNSVLTGHVWNAFNLPGPFQELGTLQYSDKVIVHAWGAEYIYEVRSIKFVLPSNVDAMMKHEDKSWVTLVTCQGYDEATDTYEYRILVRSVLVEVK
jgi:LPXTG-site transpeptidase (sortase) family protein